MTNLKATPYPIDQFDLVSTPNDFNTKTLVDFIDSGVIKIPGFQRNFVWDIRRASRLIESMIVGLPVPQMFLYEQARDKYLLIDGQQRLMSIYYFVKGRFPRKEKLAELRLASQGNSAVPADVLSDEEYFNDFRLSLPANAPGKPNRFHRQEVFELGRELSNLLRSSHYKEHPSKRKLDLPGMKPCTRFSIGPSTRAGLILLQQEIRRCMYDSEFYEMLYLTNTEESWRRLCRNPYPRRSV